MSSFQDPTKTSSPLIATEMPNWSFVAPSEATSFAAWVPTRQPPAGRTNTYAEPWSSFGPLSSSFAPTTMVSPSMATEKPKKSSEAPSDAVSRAALREGSTRIG